MLRLLKTEHRQFTCKGTSVASYRSESFQQPVPFHILFLHGRFSTQETFLPLIEQLSRKYTSITLDLPGFGLSPCSDQVRLSRGDHLDLFKEVLSDFGAWNQPLIVVGHDLGCSWAEWIIEKFQEQVHGVVYINAFLPERPVSLLQGGFRAWRHRKALKKLCSNAKNLDEDWVEKFRQAWSENRQRRSLERVLESLAQEWSGEEYEDTIQMQRYNAFTPALILWGIRDEVNLLSHGLKLFAQLPSSSFFENELCGHWPHLEATEWVYDRMSAFLFELEANLNHDQKFL